MIYHHYFIWPVYIMFIINIILICMFAINWSILMYLSFDWSVSNFCQLIVQYHICVIWLVSIVYLSFDWLTGSPSSRPMSTCYSYCLTQSKPTSTWKTQSTGSCPVSSQGDSPGNSPPPYSTGDPHPPANPGHPQAATLGLLPLVSDPCPQNPALQGVLKVSLFLIFLFQ